MNMPGLPAVWPLRPDAGYFRPARVSAGRGAVSVLRRACIGILLLWATTTGMQAVGSETAGCRIGSTDGEENYGGLAAGDAPAAAGYGESVLAEVVGIIDGQTVQLLLADGAVWQIRLKGVAAPQEGQPFAAASRLYLETLVAGKRVRVESAQYDSFGELLGNLWVTPSDCGSCGKTLYVNHALILAGLAWCSPRDQALLSEEDQGRFDSAEQEARQRNWGLWADPDATPPWIWQQ